MGVTRKKITYDCDCGVDYGSCGRRNFYILEVHRVTDFHRLYHKRHADEPNAKLEELMTTGDAGMAALVEVLITKGDTESVSKEEIEEIKEVSGW